MNKPQADGSVALSAVPYSEWAEVVKANQQLPAEQRRYFILDYIEDGSELDCMVIEAPADEYRVWIREHMASKRNREAGKNFQFLSLDAALSGNDEFETLLDYIPSANGTEEIAYEQLLTEALRKELAAWRPWANDLLDMYLRGKKRDCTDELAQKYAVSPQVIRKYKRQFEDFIKKYLGGVSF